MVMHARCVDNRQMTSMLEVGKVYEVAKAATKGHMLVNINGSWRITADDRWVMVEGIEPGTWITADCPITGDDWTVEITEGNEYYVHSVSHTGLPLVDCDDDIRRFVEPKYFKPGVARDTTEQEKNMNKENWGSYSFNVRSMAQVNHSAIEQDLSWSNPLMIMEYGAKKRVYVYISETVWNKAENCGMYNELSDMVTSTGRFDGGWRVKRSTLPDVIALVKRIKQAKWDNPRRCECKVIKVSI